MGIQRYSTARTYSFSPGTRNSLEPMIAGSAASTGATLTPATFANSSLYTKSSIIGTTNPGLYFAPMTNNVAQSANYYLYFGRPVDSEAFDFNTTSNLGRFQPPVIFKGQNESLFMSFTLRLPVIANSAVADCPIIIMGINTASTTANTSQCSYVRLGAQTTHDAAGIGSLSLLMNGTNMNASGFGFSAAGEVEYPCTWTVNGDGTSTATMAGTTMTGLSATYRAGLVYLAICHGSSSQSNMCGIKDVRIVVS